MPALTRLLLPSLVLVAAAWPADLPRAKWIENGLIDAGGSHEPCIFVTRVGGHEKDACRQLDAAESEETLRRLKSQGVEVFHTHLYKGFGMAAEKPDMEKTRRTAETAHRLGLKVDTYIQWNTLAFETFFTEEPAAKDWVQRDAAGKPIMLTYDFEQAFRYRPCFANPHYLEYLKRIVRYAVQEVKTDFIHFDNFDLNAEPESCHCPYCVRGFRDRLRAKYSPALRRERFGFENVDFVEPPLWNQSNRPENITFIRDPGIQEWIDFRCQVMSDALKEVAGYAKSLNPEVVIEVNPHGITGGNRAFEAGLDHARFLKHTQVFWTEEENLPGMLEGRLVSKIRSYKLARAFDNILLTYITESDVAMAEGLAFDQTIGFAGVDPLPEGMRNYIAFYRRNREFFTGTKDVAPVALLRSYPSITYNNPKTQMAAILTEQALIQSRVPFALIFDEHLADLSKYKVLILPDSECLSDAQLASIRRFVEQGGGLVSLAQSGYYDDWRRRRGQPGLADLTARPRNDFGKGRVAYIPAAVYDGPPPPREAFGGWGNRYWTRPKNWEEIVDAVRWASRDGLGLKVGGPDYLVANWVSQPQRDLLHLVNYNGKSAPLAAPVPVELATTRPVKTVTLLSPEIEGSKSLPFQSQGGTLRFSVPPMRTYSMVVVNY